MSVERISRAIARGTIPLTTALRLLAHCDDSTELYHLRVSIHETLGRIRAR